MQCVFLMSAILLFTPLSTGLVAQEDDLPVIREELSIVNVEVPVRVFDGKRLVGDLTKEDFLLLEGGRVQKINGFFTERRILDLQREPDGRSIAAPRHFTFIMRLTQLNESFKTGMSRLARELLRPGDQIDIWINDQALLSYHFHLPDEFEDWLLKGVKPFVLGSDRQLNTMIRRIETRIMQYNMKKSMNDLSPNDTLLFLQEYLKSFQQYKKLHLAPDISMYYRYASRLQRIPHSKWVLSFYQYHLFPKLKIGGPLMREMESLVQTLYTSRPEDAVYANLISSALQQLHTEFGSSSESSLDEAIARLFYKVNASFHAIFIPTFEDLLLEDIELKSINTSLENSLRQLIDLTGGSLQTTGDISSALAMITRREDIIYLLSYAPSNPEKPGRISISLPKHSYTVRYDDQMREDYLRDFFSGEEQRKNSLLINNLRLENDSVLFTISGFMTHEANSTASGIGNMRVALRISDCDQLPILDEEATLTASKKEISVSIPITQKLPDCSNIVVEVVDLLSGSTAQSWIKHSAPHTTP